MSYSVIFWDNEGERFEVEAGSTLDEALVVAKQRRISDNRTVKIGKTGNTIFHWTRAVHLDRNHWSQRATADEWFV